MTNSPDGIWIVSADLSTLYASSAMCTILGADQSDLIGKSSFDYLFPEDVGAAQRLFQSRQRGDAAPFHFRLRRIWVDVQGTPMHNVAGVFIRIVGTFRVAEPRP
jgi:PAS domain S-box-containing protein